VTIFAADALSGGKFIRLQAKNGTSRLIGKSQQRVCPSGAETLDFLIT
jgi:hypothetical protein